MRHTPTPIRSAAARGPRRPAGRRGSILIMVIALLVMLALIGTVFITTARTDRSAAAISTSTAQLDLLAKSATDLAVSAIVGDLFAGPNPTDYRKPLPINPPPVLTAPGYRHWDSPVTDTFLASRVPTGASPGTWEWITGPLSLGGGGPAAFNDPTATPGTWTNRHNLVPGFFANGQPALMDVGVPRVAADADGDGVADSGLVRLGALPSARFSGLTFYAGVRVIDGNSALNLSTAWKYTNDTDPATGTAIRNNRIFPTSIGLQEVLHNAAYRAPAFGTAAAGDRIDRDPTAFPFTNVRPGPLNNYRFGPAGADLLTATTADPQVDYDPAASARRTPHPRADFDWTSQMDWFWHQLGRRLEFPGYNSANTVDFFRPLPLSDTLELASRFGVRRRNSQLVAADFLPASLAATSRTVPYGPAELTTWYDTFDPTSLAFNLRTLAVTRNPVSNAAPVHRVTVGTLTNVPPVPEAYTGAASMGLYDYNFRGEWNAATAYQQGDVVVHNQTTGGAGTPTDSRQYLSLTNTNTNNNPFTSAANWRYIPYSTVPTRVDANKAGFSDLWRAYWNVMGDAAAGGAATAPFIGAVTPADIFRGNRWSVVAASNTYANTVTSPPAPTDVNPNRMFRSPIRDTRASTFAGASGVVLPPSQVALLRSAIAAVNTMDYRVPSDAAVEPTFQSINLTAQVYTGGAPADVQVRAVVFGNKQQPFITEVYVSTDITNDHGAGSGPNTDWYVAIKLHNPYPVAIDVSGWLLDTLDRTPTATADTQAPVTIGAIPAGTVIGPNGFILLENYDPAGGGVITHRPPSSGLAATGTLAGVAYVPTTATTGLCAATLLNHELVIRRPLAAVGVPQPMPIDSFDFTGIVSSPSGGPTNVYHYVRQDTLSRFVYPGRYDGAPQATYGNGELFHQQGVNVFTYAAPATDATVVPAPLLTTSAAVASYPVTFPIPLRNSAAAAYTGLPGPNPITGAINLFPFGQFMRDGDLLQVPFIGSYVIDTGAAVGAPVYEMNAISADAAMAEDTSTTDDFEESVGRFVPLAAPPTTGSDPAIAAGTGVLLDEFGNNSGTSAGVGDQFIYGWAGRLFDYLTVSSPQQDHTPNVDPVRYIAGGGTASPQPVSHTAEAFSSPSTAVGASTAGTEGLVNINTAPVTVLAAVPWTRVPAANVAIANAIVAYRSSPYPAGSPNAALPSRLFHNLFELNQVPTIVRTAAQAPLYGGNGFRDQLANWNLSTNVQTTPAGPVKTHDNGDFTPWTTAFPGTDGSNEAAAADTLGGDYKALNLALMSVSNLVTTRSDTFTVYVVVEGWENAGTAGATRVIQRRYAYWVDRTNVTPTNRNPKIVPIPAD